MSLSSSLVGPASLLVHSGPWEGVQMEKVDDAVA